MEVAVVEEEAASEEEEVLEVVDSEVCMFFYDLNNLWLMPLL